MILATWTGYFSVLEDAEETKKSEVITSVLDPTHIWSHSFQTADFIETVFQSRRPLSNPTQQQQQSFVDIVTMPPRVDLQEKNRLRRFGKENGGRASAVWITTNEGGGCMDAPSGRENYVRELIMVMDVDIYGPCMNNSVWPVHPDTQKRVNCQDYITRHVADALTVGAVPIVDGNPLDYSRFSPTENAFLQISEFLAPELLAQEVDRMDKNDTLYWERLAYRSHGGVGVEVMAEGEGAAAAALSPLFKQTFGGAVPESTVSATLSSSSSILPSTGTWPPDRHGAYCGICQLAHSLAQNTYDWTAHIQQRDEIVNITLSLATTKPTCEPSPRYLPGLPTQMEAYDAFLQDQNEVALVRQQQKMEALLQQEQVDNGSVLGPSTTVHVVNVTVSFDDKTNNTGSKLTDPSSGGGNGAANQNSLENDNIISQPSIVVLHQDVSTSSSSSSSSQSKAQEFPGLDPATAYHHIPGDNTLSATSSADDGTTLPLSEVHYLLLLILTMFVGVGALVLVLSKSARHKLFWPWRHLFYKKLPRDDLNVDALTLERVMLQELGEDLLYD
ncbi:Alpha-(1,3)-fucosyltransferase 11 [Linnemannia gamsii]|uniref:Fucosyltransferase n=1 Tax=Linnemannia gamsii TaxID=64522 RepID=A0ABQ7JTQ2_9FUNG|nr:Alpha-(1,3)-fucosyltransferase 11 [Linnemannia gamsii]